MKWFAFKGFMMRKALPFMVVIAILAVLVVINSPHTQLSRSVASSAARSSASSSSTHQVTYKVMTSRETTGYPSCFGFDTTYQMPSGTAQKSVSICDGATNTVVDQRSGMDGDFLYLSVQNDKMSAQIACEIYVDGTLVYRTFSQGQYVIASCSGSLD